MTHSLDYTGSHRPDDPQWRGGMPTKYGDVTPSLFIGRELGVPYETVLVVQHRLTFGDKLPGYHDLVHAVADEPTFDRLVDLCQKQVERWHFLQGTDLPADLRH